MDVTAAWRNEWGGPMRDTLIGIEQYGEGVVSEIIRPAAIVPEDAARQILATLQAQSLDKGGCWVATPRQ